MGGTTSCIRLKILCLGPGWLLIERFVILKARPLDVLFMNGHVYESHTTLSRKEGKSSRVTFLRNTVEKVSSARQHLSSKGIRRYDFHLE